jgi:hypothetical protein
MVRGPFRGEFHSPQVDSTKLAGKMFNYLSAETKGALEKGDPVATQAYLFCSDTLALSDLAYDYPQGGHVRELHQVKSVIYAEYVLKKEEESSEEHKARVSRFFRFIMDFIRAQVHSDEVTALLKKK